MKGKRTFILCLVFLLVAAGICQDQDIFEAIVKGDLTTVKSLLEKDPGLLMAKGRNGVTPLHIAAFEGQLEIVKMLCEKGADVRAGDTQLGTPLHYAAYNGQDAVVGFLIDRGVDVDIKNESGATPLFLAVNRGKKSTADLLISRGSDINAMDSIGYSALRIACIRNNGEMVQFLADKGARINQRLDAGNTLLHESAAEGRKEIMEIFIARGLDVEVKNKAGQTPLHLAAFYGQKDCAAFLIEKGADISLQDGAGDTPLHGAAWGGHKAVVELLVSGGADLVVQNAEGRTALDCASANGKKETADFMRAAGAQGAAGLWEEKAFAKVKQAQGKGLKSPLKFTILYDNYVSREGTKSDWGFSCLIEGAEKTILFDTGTRSDILWHNIKEVDVDASRVDQIVISHIHLDHTGGLFSVLEKHHDVEVYLPHTFPYDFFRRVDKSGARSQPVNQPVQICENVYSTGEMGDRIKEQSLIINTQKGLIIVTGCSHQGIVNILDRAREMFDSPIYLVFGGFHLGGTPRAELEKIVQSFKDKGVVKCGATHCTGDEAIGMFKEAYGENYVSLGTGRVLEIETAEEKSEK
ncbi:MAG: ankyrin repeat domain-containing protein [Candidatus Aminicenantes bacterium]|nr:ankyrin repeat domain-containing protein [Candidatus Aminicenantes bacterium]